MKTLIAATVAVAAIAGAAPALAAPPTGYANLGYTRLDGDGLGLGQVDGRMGLRFGPNIGVEGELGMGVQSDDTSVAGVRGTVKALPSAAAYAVGFLPVSPKIDLLARVGYGTERFHSEVASVGHTDTDHSVNYGVGAQYFLTDSDGVRLDYTRKNLNGQRDDLNAYSVAYVRRF